MNFLPELEFNIATILFFIFLLMGLLQLLYVIIIHGKFAFYPEEKKQQLNFPPLSILISARNESDNLFENLPFILEQDYPNFEVIVINRQMIQILFYMLIRDNIKTFELLKLKKTDI